MRVQEPAGRGGAVLGVASFLCGHPYSPSQVLWPVQLMSGDHPGPMHHNFNTDQLKKGIQRRVNG
jgi:hypothetical protein